MFSQAAPLVVGDDSKNYQTIRKLYENSQQDWEITVDMN